MEHRITVTAHRWVAAVYLQQGTAPYSLQKHLMLSRICDKKPSTHLLHSRAAPASWLTVSLPAPPAKDKADDRGEGKNQICESTKHKSLWPK